jgi:hypothetical protein
MEWRGGNRRRQLLRTLLLSDLNFEKKKRVHRKSRWRIHPMAMHTTYCVS